MPRRTGDRVPAIWPGMTLTAMLLLAAAPFATAADRIANAEAARWYHEGSPALFVDLRTAGERAQGGRLARALWIPLRADGGIRGPDAARLADEILRAAEGDRLRTVVLVCELGVKAAAAADALLARGFRTVLSVDGGLWAGEPWLAFELE